MRYTSQDRLRNGAGLIARQHNHLPALRDISMLRPIRARLGTASEPALMLSSSAIFQRDGAPHVWRVLREGNAAHVEAVRVTPIADFHDRVLIGEGLASGDEVVIRGVNSLTDGQPVGERVQP